MKFKSNVYTQASGSIGGITYSRNAGGMYTRSRTIPTNPNTALQQDAKSRLSTLADRWVNVLTDAQRAAWAVYAQQVPLINTLGETRPIPANAMYIRCNSPRLLAGLAAVDAGPTNYTLATLTPPTVPSITAATDTVEYEFSNADPWATAVGGALLVFISRPQNETVNFFKGPFQFAGSTLGAVVPPASPDSQVSNFAIAVGQRVFARFIATEADGRLSADVIRFLTAT